MGDRRRITSRPNLTGHIPTPLELGHASRVLTVRVTISTYRQLEQAAERQGVTISEHVRRILKQPEQP